jgi:hypothetical protein
VADTNSKSSLANGQGHHHLLEKQPRSFVTVSDTNSAQRIPAEKPSKFGHNTLKRQVQRDLSLACR